MNFQEFFNDPRLHLLMLVFARTSGLMALAPPLSNKRISFQVKGGLAFFLAIASFPFANSSHVELPTFIPGLAISMIFEMAIGFIMGFGVNLIFTSFQLAGSMIDHQMGLAMANIVDPETNFYVSIFGAIMQNLGLFIFLDSGGLRWLVKTVAGSFHSIPLLTIDFHIQGLTYHIAKLMGETFIFAAQISLPIITIILLFYLSQGFIQKTMPQFQIFAVGFIVVILLGLSAMRDVLRVFADLSLDLIDSLNKRSGL